MPIDDKCRRSLSAKLATVSRASAWHSSATTACLPGVSLTSRSPTESPFVARYWLFQQKLSRGTAPGSTGAAGSDHISCPDQSGPTGPSTIGAEVSLRRKLNAAVCQSARSPQKQRFRLSQRSPGSPPPSAQPGLWSSDPNCSRRRRTTQARLVTLFGTATAGRAPARAATYQPAGRRRLITAARCL